MKKGKWKTNSKMFYTTENRNLIGTKHGWEDIKYAREYVERFPNTTIIEVEIRERVVIAPQPKEQKT